jgi:hypothetical protein
VVVPDRVIYDNSPSGCNPLCRTMSRFLLSSAALTSWRPRPRTPGQRAVQQEQARGPGYFVGLLWVLATDRAAMAQRLRTGTEAM